MRPRAKWFILQCIGNFILIPIFVLVLRPLYEQTSPGLLLAGYLVYLVSMIALLIVAYKVSRPADPYTFLTHVSVIGWPTVLALSLIVVRLKTHMDMLAAAAACTLVGIVVRVMRARRRRSTNDTRNYTPHPSVKLLCLTLQWTAAVLLFATVIGWFYLEQLFQRPEALLPSSARSFTLYLHNIPVYTSPLLARFYQGAPYVCIVLLVVIYLANIATKKIKLPLD
jgi:hypothetical protein